MTPLMARPLPTPAPSPERGRQRVSRSAEACARAYEEAGACAAVGQELGVLLRWRRRVQGTRALAEACAATHRARVQHALQLQPRQQALVDHVGRQRVEQRKVGAWQLDCTVAPKRKLLAQAAAQRYRNAQHLNDAASKMSPGCSMPRVTERHLGRVRRASACAQPCFSRALGLWRIPAAGHAHVARKDLG